MKKILFSFTILILIFSCDDRLEGFLDSNSVIVNFNNGILFDSLKFSLKNNNPYQVEIEIDNPNAINQIVVTKVFGNSNLIIQGEVIGTQVPANAITREMIIEINPIELNDIRYVFDFIDGIGSSRSFTLDLEVFENIRPIASFELTQSNRNDNLFELNFNASDSSDPDENLGGGIVQYEYTVNNNTFFSPNKITNFITDESGVVNIRLRVVDNDGAISDGVVKSISL